MTTPVLAYDGREWTLVGVTPEGGGHVEGTPWITTVNGTTLTVPVGFKFDLASIPRLLWTFLAPFELSIPAPLIHDFLYRHHGSPPGSSAAAAFTRADTDRLFFQAMVDNAVPRLKRRVAWLAVRLFGWVPWPPTKTQLRRGIVWAAHTLWETAAALWLAPNLWTVPFIAAGLSLVKTAVAPLARQWLATVTYERGPSRTL